MRIESKKTWQYFLYAFLLFLLPSTGAFAQAPSVPVQAAEVTCGSPAVSKTGQTANSVSFSWSPVSGATEYVVWYVRYEDSFTSDVTHASSTSINYSGLPAGTYCFYFATVCGPSTSGYIIQDDIIMY